MNRIVLNRSDSPFRWGSFDCALFAADVAQSITGSDPAWFFRGQYNSLFTARKVMQDYAGDLQHVMERVAREQGYEECDPNYARTGDVALIQTNRWPYCLTIHKERWLLVPTKRGWKRINRENALRSWRVE